MTLIQLILLVFFICLWLSIYGGLHYYLYKKMIPYCLPYKKSLIVVLGFFAGSVFIVEILSFTDFARIAYRFANISYFWMGLVFIFFFLSGATDVLSFLLRKSGAGEKVHFLSSKYRTGIVGIVVTFLAITGYMQARQINFEFIQLHSKKIIKPLRIIQIADLHAGVQSDEKRVIKIVNQVNALKPDIIVATGDLIEIHFGHTQRLSEILSGLKASLGKYAIYGNHEAMIGLEESKQLINAAGFTVLADQGVSPGRLITVVGVNDPAVTMKFKTDSKSEELILKTYSKGLYTILLKHQPRLNPGSTPYFDLQLSGHTHGGQIFPFGLLTRLVYPLGFGLTKIKNDTFVYVSQGIGTWGPPMRLAAKPEINVFDISKAN